MHRLLDLFGVTGVAVGQAGKNSNWLSGPDVRKTRRSVRTLAKTRRTEMSEDKLRKETRSKERLARAPEDVHIYRVTLDTVDKPNLQLIMYPGKMATTKKKVSSEAAPDSDSDLTGSDDGTKERAIDPERDEALNILNDLVDLSRGPTTASTTATKPAP